MRGRAQLLLRCRRHLRSHEIRHRSCRLCRRSFEFPMPGEMIRHHVYPQFPFQVYSVDELNSNLNIFLFKFIPTIHVDCY